jgi:hypothetical protein
MHFLSWCSQHVKVALMRFGGLLQRLRFTLGDGGIVPSTEVGAKLGNHHLRMADRLWSFTNLLSDVEVVRREGGRLMAGRFAEATTTTP